GAAQERGRGCPGTDAARSGACREQAALPDPYSGPLPPVQRGRRLLPGRPRNCGLPRRQPEEVASI
ncbi:MAG: hypothetical protein AVDCRST_MAG58-1021, partial [uncultured Rubrobacteraceae bacterium]